MRRSLVALAVAALCVLGTTGAGAPAAHDARRPGAVGVGEATAVARLAVVAIPAPQSSAPPLAGLAVLGGTAVVGAALLGYVARQRRRALLVPILTSAVRLRGPPAVRVPVPQAP
jgi:hypothetical protein